jgi:hypothetical protein
VQLPDVRASENNRSKLSGFWNPVGIRIPPFVDSDTLQGKLVEERNSAVRLRYIAE